ncbi:MAG: S49 family peptidase [Phycisphaeraceae bacterium]|nr:S49 family peptidase [Phycisphaeraceae bacterium]
MTDEQAPSPGAPRQPIDPTGTSTPPPPPPGYVPAVYVQQPSGKSGLGKIIIYLLAVGLLISVTANIYLAGPINTVIYQLSLTAPPEQPYNPTFEKTGDTSRVVVVEISGMIDGTVADFARKAFYTLENDPPAAVVIRVESGGGGVTASDQIWHAIQSFRAAHPDVPVISSFGAVAASGGYYIAAPSDYIFCERTGITGSIGVLAQVPGLGGMVEKLGVEMNMVIANKSPNKDDANNLFVEWYDDEGNLTEDGEAAVAVLENLVDDAYDTFFKVVKIGRQAADPSITTEELEQAATGAIFIGKEALDAKLVDKIGYLDDAIAHAHSEAKLSGEPRVSIIRKPVPGLLSSMLSGKEGANLGDITGQELRELVDDATAVRLEYRMRLK